MRMTDINSIDINAKTLGGIPSNYFMSSWTSLQYQVDDWNDEKRTRVYSVGSGDFKLANAPTDCYNYGLFLSFFTRTSTWGIQFYFPHNQNNYDLESYKPRFRICQSQIWTPWKILNTESLSQIMLENINNMEINKLKGGGYGGTLGFSSIEAASLLPSLMALTEQKGGQHENDRHKLDPNQCIQIWRAFAIGLCNELYAKSANRLRRFVRQSGELHKICLRRPSKFKNQTYRNVNIFCSTFQRVHDALCGSDINPFPFRDFIVQNIQFHVVDRMGRFDAEPKSRILATRKEAVAA